jgi:hypothetical protein
VNVQVNRLVVLGIRLQVDLVPELGVPIKDCRGDSSVTASRLKVTMTDGRCVEVRPAVYSALSRSVAGSLGDSCTSHPPP